MTTPTSIEHQIVEVARGAVAAEVATLRAELAAVRTELGLDASGAGRSTAVAVWESVPQAAARIGRDPRTVRRDADARALHGHQPLDADGRPIRKSRWRFHPAAVDAYVRGLDERAQRRVCGCGVDGEDRL